MWTRPELGLTPGPLHAAANHDRPAGVPVLRSLLLLGLVLGSLAGCEKRPQPRVPNLLLVSIDTLRADHTSTYGYHLPTTPALSAIARDGTVFTHAYAQSPWTIPSHASLLTGRYACSHGASFGTSVSEDVPLLSQRLQPFGYHVAGFVDTPYIGQKTGMNRGFGAYDEQQQEDLAGPRVLSWLQQLPAEAPFFLFLHTYGVHGPFKDGDDVARLIAGSGMRMSSTRDADIEYLLKLRVHDYLKLGRYSTLADVVKDYDAGVVRTDGQLATVIAWIKAMGRYDDTVIVVTSDHGESFLDHQIMVGHSFLLYDEELHVPLVIKPAGARPMRPVIDTVVESIDVLPTVLSLMGLPVPGDVDGQNLAPLMLRGDGRGLSAIAAAESSNLFGLPTVRTDRWRYIAPMSPQALSALVKALGAEPDVDVESRIRSEEQLYDVENDPGETENVAHLHPDVVVEMRGHLAAIQARCPPPPTMRPPPPRLNDDDRARLRALGYLP